MVYHVLVSAICLLSNFSFCLLLHDAHCVSFVLAEDYPGYMFFDTTNNMEYTCMDAANYEELFGGFCESYGQLVGSNGRTTQQSCCNCGGKRF